QRDEGCSTEARMIAAIYARKSTKDSRTEGDRSVDQQIAECMRFVASRGEWTVPAELVFVDNEVSARAWDQRASWTRLRDAAHAGAFQRLVVRDQNRLLRDGTHGPSEVSKVEACGVEVWTADGQRITFDDDAEDGNAVLGSQVRAIAGSI